MIEKRMRKFDNIFRPFRRGTASCPFTLKHGTSGKYWFYTNGSLISGMKSTTAEIEAVLANYRKVLTERNKCVRELDVKVALI